MSLNINAVVEAGNLGCGTKTNRSSGKFSRLSAI
jgi:hypothetical protein